MRISEREGKSGFSVQAQCELAGVTAWIEFITHRRTKADELASKARDTYAAIRDARGEGHALCELALVLGTRGDLLGAAKSLADAAEQYKNVSWTKEGTQKVTRYGVLLGINLEVPPDASAISGGGRG